MVIYGAIEKRLSDNIRFIQEQANKILKSLEKFPDNHILPVNIKKTKAMLVHIAVNVEEPDIYYENVKIEYVQKFKYLGVELGTKLGLGNYIDDRLKKVRNSYCALRKIYKTIPKDEIKIRRTLFCAFSLPHIIWLFCTWYYFTEHQKQKTEQVYGSGLRLIYNLWGYEDFTTLCLSREYSIRDQIYRYWIRFQKHLEKADEAESYRQIWTAFLIATDPATSYYKSMGLRKNNKFANKFYERVQHTYLDFLQSTNAHKSQLYYFKKTSSLLEHFVLKFYPLYPP